MSLCRPWYSCSSYRSLLRSVHSCTSRQALRIFSRIVSYRWPHSDTFGSGGSMDGHNGTVHILSAFCSCSFIYRWLRRHCRFFLSHVAMDQHPDLLACSLSLSSSLTVNLTLSTTPSASCSRGGYISTSTPVVCITNANGHVDAVGYAEFNVASLCCRGTLLSIFGGTLSLSRDSSFNLRWDSFPIYQSFCCTGVYRLY
jgi:hypothetical protein